MPPKVKAKGHLRKADMNKTEIAYADHLIALEASGKILWWSYQGLRLRLGDKTSYTPDFIVLAADYILECHEVKGFWRLDARVKFKVAASLYPFRFKEVQALPKKSGGGWKIKEF